MRLPILRSQLPLLLLPVLIYVTALALAVIAWGPTYIQNDGVQYLSTANNWLKGQGFSTNALLFDPHLQATLPAPQTVWPPGYPLLIALLSHLGISTTHAAIVIGLLAQGFTAYFIFRVLRKYGVSGVGAAFGAALFLTMLRPWSAALGGLSDPLFCAFTTAALYYLPGASSQFQPGRFSSWVICGALLGGAIAVRYTGVFFTASVGSAVFIILAYKSMLTGRLQKRQWLGAAITVCIPLLVFLGLLTRNKLLTGHLLVNSGADNGGSLIDAFRITYRGLSSYFGFSNDGYLPERVYQTAFLAMCLSALVLVATGLKAIAGRGVGVGSALAQPGYIGSYQFALIFVAVLHVIIVLSYFAYCAIGTANYKFTSRYAIQLAPSLIIVFMAFASRAGTFLNPGEGVKPSSIAGFFAVAGLCLYIVGQVNSVGLFGQQTENGALVQSLLRVDVKEDESLANVIAGCAGDDGSIWSNESQLMHLHSGIPTIGMPMKHFTAHRYDWNHIQQQIEQYRVKVMVLIDHAKPIGRGYATDVDQINTWASSAGLVPVKLHQNELETRAQIYVYATSKGCVN